MLPMAAMSSASSLTAAYFGGLARLFAWHDDGPEQPSEPEWPSSNRVVLELPSMRLRDFSQHGSRAVPTLVCAPFALHRSTVADFAPGHSLVEALQNAGRKRLYVTDWRSATPQMRFLSIDHYLADLNVAVDDIGPPVDVVGLCQGGWLALLYCARFPDKVRRLVLAGAPIDVRAGDSVLSRVAADMPRAVFDEIVRLGDGRILGHRLRDIWGPEPTAEGVRRILQCSPNASAPAMRELEERFHSWYGSTVDLPGVYYLQVVDWLYKENRLARGRFPALGRNVDLAQVRVPMLLLAARDDDVVAPAQLLAAAELVGTPASQIETITEPGGHLSLFLGERMLRSVWPRIVRWLDRDFALACAS